MRQSRRRKSNLDEMQEQRLLLIESKCFWGLYWMLFASIMVQLVLGKWEIAGELICFLIISAAMVASCIRNGIWDRHLKADRKTSILLSLIAAAVVAGINGMLYASNTYEHYGPMQLVLVLLIPAALTFMITLLLLLVCASMYNKRVQQLEEQEDQTND